MKINKKIFFGLTFFIILISGECTSQYSLEWTARYNSTGLSRDDVNDMVMDKNGNLILTGRCSNQYTTIKYDNNGNQLWSNQYPNHFTAMDIPYALVSDDSGNVYITGEASVEPFNKDYVTVKYTSSGIKSWDRSYNNPAGATDRAYNIAIYKNRYLYISGTSSYGDSGGCKFKWTTIKYDLNGNSIWERQFCGYWTYILGDYASRPSMSLDSSGNIIITGLNQITPSACCNYEIVTIKYDSSGSELWLKRNPSELSSEAIAVDANSNIYVGIRDGFIKFNPEGDSIGSQISFPVQKISFDSSGNVITSGNRHNDNRIVTSKFDSLCNLIWSTQTLENYYLSSMFVSKNGKIFVAGSALGFINRKFYMFVYNNSGSLFWSMSYNELPDTSCTPVKILSDNYDNLYITGRSSRIETGGDILTLKYSILTNTDPQNSNYAGSFILNDNYPNPFNPKTRISYTLPTSEFTTLKIFDAVGKEVGTLVNEMQNGGSYSVDFDGDGLSSGVYFYKLEAGDFVETKRMVLLK